MGCAPCPECGTSGAAGSGRGGLRGAGRGVSWPRRRNVLDGPPEELETGRVEVVAPRTDALGPGEASVEAGGKCLARHEDEVGTRIDPLDGVVVADERRDELDAGRAGQLDGLEDVVRTALVGADESDARPRREPRDLVDELEVPGPDEHRDDRDTP